MKRKAVIAGVVVLALSIFGLAYSQPVELEAVKVYQGTAANAIAETGYVQTKDEQDIQSALFAKVTAKHVDISDKVSAGQLLFKLESLDLQAELDQQQARLVQLQTELKQGRLRREQMWAEMQKAKLDMQRQSQLHQAGAISDTQYEELVLHFDSINRSLSSQDSYLTGLENQLASISNSQASLQAKSEQLSIYSPIDGIVLDLPVKVGDMVTPGTLLAQIGSTEGWEVRSEILSDDLKEVKVGQKVEVSASILGDKVLLGTVSKIYPRAYERISALGVAQRRVPVIISIDDPDRLKPGYEVKVAIETVHRKGVLIIPRGSVQLNAQGQETVIRIDNQRAQRVAVTTGIKNQLYAEITSGLEPGDIIIKDGSAEIKEKSRIKVKLVNY